MHSQLLRSKIELILLARLPDGIKTDLTNQIQYLKLRRATSGHVTAWNDVLQTQMPAAGFCYLPLASLTRVLPQEQGQMEYFIYLRIIGQQMYS